MLKKTQKKNQKKNKLLIIRFSSFGDIVQAISIPYHFLQKFPNSEIHWLTREDFCEILTAQTRINKVISFSRRSGAWGLIKMAWKLSGDGYTHVYDAHNNLRSKVVMSIFFFRAFTFFFKLKTGWFLFLTRPKNRLRRFLLFRLGWNSFEKPFIASKSYLEPLSKWGIFFDHKNPLADNHFLISKLATEKVTELLAKERFFAGDFIALVPSAAWQMKRWPPTYWKQLIEQLPNEKFIILGGPEDHFCEELALVAPLRVLNLSGQLSLIESSAVIAQAKLAISGDTGLLHVSDQIQKNCIALIGPAAFGFPASPNSSSLYANLYCQPCSKDGRGHCRNKVYQKCMLDITPHLVADHVKQHLQVHPEAR